MLQSLYVIDHNLNGRKGAKSPGKTIQLVDALMLKKSFINLY